MNKNVPVCILTNKIQIKHAFRIRIHGNSTRFHNKEKLVFVQNQIHLFSFFCLIIHINVYLSVFPSIATYAAQAFLLKKMTTLYKIHLQ